MHIKCSLEHLRTLLSSLMLKRTFVSKGLIFLSFLIGYSHPEFLKDLQKVYYSWSALEGTQELNRPSNKKNLLGMILAPMVAHEKGI
jgi:hypothetical protein